MNTVLRERSPDQKNVFPGDAASTLRVLPHALPVGSGAVPYGACPRKNIFSLVSAHLPVYSYFLTWMLSMRRALPRRAAVNTTKCDVSVAGALRSCALRTEK
jgi:hypothetical protein